MTNALQALLGAPQVSEITDTVKIARLGTEFTVKALTTEDVQKLKDEAAVMGKNGKLTVDEEQLGLLMVVKATVDPDFKDAQVLKHFDAKTPSQAVQKALLPGEFATLTKAVIAVSGLAPATTEEIEEVKN